MNIDQNNVEELVAKLDVLVKLTAAALINGKSSTEQIKLLARAGLQPKEIAKLTGKTANNVRVTLSLLRKTRTKKKAHK